MSTAALEIRAGRLAWQHLQQFGLHASRIAVLPAAAGGPKGLILQELDLYLFGHWLPQAPRQRSLIGASIGAWRMAAASQADPVSALQRMGEAYVRQSYSAKPRQSEITHVINQVVSTIIAGHEAEILQQPQHHLHIVTVRGKRGLAQPQTITRSRLGFARAALANTRSRAALAHHLERVIFSQNPAALTWLSPHFDAFPSLLTSFTTAKLHKDLIASGTLPLLMQQVSDIADAPAGNYWDGGIIDYHLQLPYQRLNSHTTRLADAELVLYPHFHHQIIPGWLDKGMWWRRGHRGKYKEWLDNVILINPSRAFVQSLPRAKIPDRKDFYYHGIDHASRIKEWQTAIAAGKTLREEFIAFCQQPDMKQVLPLNF